MNLRRDVQTITQTTGIFAISGLCVGSFLFRHNEPANRGVELYAADDSPLVLLMSSFVGLSAGLFFGCAKAVFDNIHDCCQPQKREELVGAKMA